MDNKNLKSLMIITALMFGLSTSPAWAVEFSDVEKEKLAAGKTIKKPLPNSGNKGFYGGTGFTLIDAPVDVVWNAILDWSAYPAIFPKTVSVKELSKKGKQSLVEIKMGHKLVTIQYSVNIVTDSERHIMSFELATNRPHDIESSKGYWRLFPQKNGQTLVAYVVSASVPMGIINLIPNDLTAKIERNLIGAPNDLKKWLMSSRGNKYFTMTAKK